MKKYRGAVRAILFILGIPAMAYGVYLGYLYKQLEVAFLHQDEYIPTRIFTDVQRVAPPMPRKSIVRKLKNLQYNFKEEDVKITFLLRDMIYPTYLLPENHVTLKLAKKTIELQFDGTKEDSMLTVIRTPEGEIEELYLEPELVASLSRASEAGKDETKDNTKIRQIIKFEEFPSTIWKAIIAIEDPRFLDHRGLDPRGLLRAVFVNLKTLSLAQGGSTLTQQLVKNLFARTNKNVFKKVSETFLAPILEVRFEKEQILERYLNEIYLGQIGNYEIHGVSEGAKYFFGKRIQDLNLAEHALLAGLIRGPFYYSPYRYLDRAVGRQKIVLQKMMEAGQITEAEMQVALKYQIHYAPPPLAQNKAPYFTDYVKAELIDLLKDHLSESDIPRAGFRVFTTLDLHLNQVAQEAVSKGVVDLENRLASQTKLKNYITPVAIPRIEGALASAEPSTGFVRVLVGGRDYGKSSFNRILNMKRPVGSTFKPVVYLAAFDSRDPEGTPYGPAYPMEDTPWKLIYDKGKQNWEPGNYDPEYKGWLTLRESLAFSVNTVAGRLGNQVGLSKIIEMGRKLGITSEIPEVPSVTLGVVELSPVELVQVYSTLANRGSRQPLSVIRAITEDDGKTVARNTLPPTQTIETGQADQMTDVLKDVFSYGTAKAAAQLGFTAPAAGKTGTTSAHRDAWFAGYSPELVTVVWTGFDTGSSTNEKGDARLKLTGAGSALPIWIQYMKEALPFTHQTPFVDSEHLHTVRIDRFTGKKSNSHCPESQVISEKYRIGFTPQDETCLNERPKTELVTTQK